MATVGQARSAPPLKHVLIVIVKENTPAREIGVVDVSFKNMADKLPMVKGYDWGPALPQRQAKTTTHVYVFSFSSEKDLVDHAKSPEHQQHMKIGTAIIERVQAVQYRPGP